MGNADAKAATVGAASAPHLVASCAASLEPAQRAALRQWWQDAHGRDAGALGLPPRLHAVLGLADYALFEHNVAALLEPKRGLDHLVALLHGSTTTPPEPLSAASVAELLRLCAECYWSAPGHVGVASAPVAPTAAAVATDEECAQLLKMVTATLTGAPDEHGRFPDLLRVAAKVRPGLGSEPGRLLAHRCGGAFAPPLLDTVPVSTALTTRMAQWQLSLLPFRATPAQWTRLYADGAHGDGANAFYRCVGMYAAPTVLLVRTVAGDVLGAHCDATWENSASSFFGSTGCFLFALEPEAALFESTPQYGRNFMYFHLPTGKGTPEGIGAGGQMGAFRLTLDSELRAGVACRYDSTYREGTLCARGALTDATPDAVGERRR